jgi:hypothetical protein
MRHDSLAAVPRVQLRHHVHQALHRYWPKNGQLPLRLGVVECQFPVTVHSLKLVLVPLPEWAAQFGVDASLAVPVEACVDPGQPKWTEVDWWLAAFLMLEAWHERAWEGAHGVIHSYSWRLADWDERIWARAWVNRIGLLLRAWAAVDAGQDAVALFGPLPAPTIVMTHDVDAVTKTWPIRLKQSAFLSFNAVRQAAKGRPGAALAHLVEAFNFMIGRGDWWMLEVVLNAEHCAGIRSQFNFYADERPKNLRRWIFDPGYEAGFGVGLHQSYDAWQSPELMRRQRERLQGFARDPVTSCRQHWLRFSWRDTWAAQWEAGFEQDTTLMFNDRPGLRSATALNWKPWNSKQGRSHALTALPTVLMDSHFHDYQSMSPTQRREAYRYWLDEVVAVGGEAAVLWHPHTLARDYGWSEGFLELVAELKGRAACATS